MTDPAMTLQEYLVLLDVAVADYLRSDGNDAVLNESVPDFIPLLFKAGYNAGFEAARATEPTCTGE